MDLFDLSGRKALVTGASRGIGLAIAAEFAGRGAGLAITARKAENLAEAQRQLGADTLAIPCHQGERAQIDSLFETLDAQKFFAEIVVVNAATNPVMGPLVDTDFAAWQKIMGVNLTGAFWTARQAAERMIAHGRGVILFVSSIAGIDPLPGLGAYSVSKAGVIGLMKSLAKELGSHGIRVNAIAPGLVETRFSKALFDSAETYQRIMAPVPLARHGQPQDVVGAAVFLASDAARYITGQVLLVDGGARV